MSRQRKQLPAEAVDLQSRFARRLRALMSKNGWSSKIVAERLTREGVAISARGVDVWLRGTSGPKFRDLEAVGRALGLKDYRLLLPPPLSGK